MFCSDFATNYFVVCFFTFIYNLIGSYKTNNRKNNEEIFDNN